MYIYIYIICVDLITLYVALYISYKVAYVLQMDRHTCACTLVIILVICEINAALGKSKPVSISLDAKWKSTPVLLEAR